MNLKDIPSITGAELQSYADEQIEFMKEQKIVNSDQFEFVQRQKEWNKKHDEFAKEQEKFDNKILESLINVSNRTFEQHRTVLIIQTLNSIAIILLAIALILRW